MNKLQKLYIVLLIWGLLGILEYMVYASDNLVVILFVILLSSIVIRALCVIYDTLGIMGK